MVESDAMESKFLSTKEIPEIAAVFDSVSGNNVISHLQDPQFCPNPSNHHGADLQSFVRVIHLYMQEMSLIAKV